MRKRDPRGRHRAPLLSAPDLRHRSLGQVEPGRDGEEAVVLVGVARRRDHRVPPAVRSAGDVRTVRAASVGGGDKRLGHRSQSSDRLVAVVESRLRVEPEERVLAPLCPASELITAIPIWRPLSPPRVAPVAVATRHRFRRSPGTGIGRSMRWQAHLKPMAYVWIDRAHSLVHPPRDEAVFSDGLSAVGEDAGRHDRRCRDDGARVSETDEGRALLEGAWCRGIQSSPGAADATGGCAPAGTTAETTRAAAASVADAATAMRWGRRFIPCLPDRQCEHFVVLDILILSIAAPASPV